MAALAPMPSARVSATVMASPLLRASERRATLKSRRNDIEYSSRAAVVRDPILNLLRQANSAPENLKPSPEIRRGDHASRRRWPQGSPGALSRTRQRLAAGRLETREKDLLRTQRTVKMDGA